MFDIELIKLFKKVMVFFKNAHNDTCKCKYEK